MIPASYMFKNAYQSAWEEPDKSTPGPQGPSFIDGLRRKLKVTGSALSHRIRASRLPTLSALAQQR
jgi:hypothetical protein